MRLGQVAPCAARALRDSASRSSWSGVSSTSQSCHSPPPSASARTGALSEASPPRRRFMEIDIVLGHAELGGDLLDLVGPRSPSSSALICPFMRRRLKNSFFCAAVVPIFTRLQERRMYSWIEARIHHMA